jgi:asparagine synthase (glutamine-hydrolysing)
MNGALIELAQSAGLAQTPEAGAESFSQSAPRERQSEFQFELRTGASSADVLDNLSRPPDVVTASGGRLFWNGRLDDGDALGRQLQLPLGTSDAQLVAGWLERSGAAELSQLHGRWTLAWVSASGSCLLARDPLGGRDLFWAEVPGGVVVATDWEPLFDDPRWDRSHDPDTLAAFFSVHLSPEDGRTFFQGLHLVPPGTVVQLTPTLSRPDSYWQPSTEAVWQGSEAEAESEYRRLLKQAVSAAVADARAPMLLLSSGLDSSSIAAVAKASAIPVQALSWSVKSVPAVDETPWIREFVTDLGMRWDLTPADGIWPLHQVSEYLPTALGPLTPPLEGLRQRLYRRAVELGGDVVLTGDGGDLLFLGAEGWLRALLDRGQWAAASRGLRTEWRAGRARGCLSDLVRSALPSRVRTWSRHQALPWLTNTARDRLAGRLGALNDRGGVRRLRALRSDWADLREAALAPGYARMKLDVRHPFREQRLAEFLLSLPPHLLFQPGASKRLARRGMHGLLPDSTRMAPRRGTLLPLAQRFLTDSMDSVRRILRLSNCDWQRWVREDWMEAALHDLPRSGRDGAAWVVVWNCVVYELWKQRWPAIAHTLHFQTNLISARGS